MQVLSQRLAASESCVVQQQRQIIDLRDKVSSLSGAGDSGAEGGVGQVEEVTALKEENLMLESELRDALDANNLAAGDSCVCKSVSAL